MSRKAVENKATCSNGEGRMVSTHETKKGPHSRDIHRTTTTTYHQTKGNPRGKVEIANVRARTKIAAKGNESYTKAPQDEQDGRDGQFDHAQERNLGGAKAQGQTEHERNNTKTNAQPRSFAKLGILQTLVGVGFGTSTIVGFILENTDTGKENDHARGAKGKPASLFGRGGTDSEPHGFLGQGTRHCEVSIDCTTKKKRVRGMHPCKSTRSSYARVVSQTMRTDLQKTAVAKQIQLEK
jgi:hypothetical protein